MQLTIDTGRSKRIAIECWRIAETEPPERAFETLGDHPGVLALPVMRRPKRASYSRLA